MDRLAYPRAPLNREGSIPRLTRTQGSQDRGQREKLEPQGPRRVRAVGQEKQPPRRGLSCGLGKWGHSSRPQEVQWRREMDRKGAERCWFWFYPSNMVERDRLRP